jgi:hypothetical protein
MLTLKQAFAKGHPRLSTQWNGHKVAIQEIGPVGYELWVDGQMIARWNEKLLTRRHLANGVVLPSTETLAIPEDHEWTVEE